MRPDRLHAEPPPSGSDPGRRPDAPTPPDLDQLWLDFLQRLQSGFGRRPSARPPQPPRPPRWRPTLPLVLGLLLLLAWLASGVRSVAPGQQASLSLLGRRTAIVGPGNHWYWPAPLGQASNYEVQTPRQLEVGAGDGPDGAPLLSRDRRLLDLRLQLSYRIVDLPAYLDHAADPDQLLAAQAQSDLRSAAANLSASQLLAADHGGIEASLQSQLQQTLRSAGLGLQLQQVSVLQAQPPAAVLAAGERLQQQLSQARQQLSEARGQAQAQASADAALLQQQQQQAQAERDAALRQARSDAQRFLTLLPSYARAPQTTLDTLTQQTMVDVLGHAEKVVVDASQAHPVIRIEAGAAAPKAAAAAVPAASAAPAAPVGSTPERALTRDRDAR